MNGFEIAVTLKGKTLGEVIEQAKSLIDANESTAPIAAKRGRPTKAKEIEAASDVELMDEDTTTATDDADDFSFDEDEVAAPKSAKSKKLTDKDVNNAAMAHAKENGRKATLSILAKKFKVKSILELKPEQYATVIEALAV